VRGFGGKERRFMSKHIKNEYTDEPLGDVRVIEDFLPEPEDLVFKEDNVKVTLGLSRRSVEFFKREAKKHHTQYQKMIRRLLDLYAARHQ
jgi:predicted DNA binding CopG/RHH family protein